MKFVPTGAIGNIASLIQIMAWRRSGDKRLSEPMMTYVANAYARHLVSMTYLPASLRSRRTCNFRCHAFTCQVWIQQLIRVKRVKIFCIIFKIYFLYQLLLMTFLSDKIPASVLAVRILFRFLPHHDSRELFVNVMQILGSIDIYIVDKVWHKSPYNFQVHKFWNWWTSHDIFVKVESVTQCAMFIRL